MSDLALGHTMPGVPDICGPPALIDIGPGWYWMEATGDGPSVLTVPTSVRHIKNTHDNFPHQRTHSAAHAPSDTCMSQIGAG